MIANLTAGNKVKFQYLKRNRDLNIFPAEVTYAVEDIEGEILAVRDTAENKLNVETWHANPTLERSRFLLTVQIAEGKIKSFYDGRVINLTKLPEPAPKSFVKRMVDKWLS